MKGAYRALSIVLVGAVVGSAILVGGTIGWKGMSAWMQYDTNVAQLETASYESTQTAYVIPPTHTPMPTLTPLESILYTGTFMEMAFDTSNPLTLDTYLSSISGMISKRYDIPSFFWDKNNPDHEVRLYWTIADIQDYLACKNNGKSSCPNGLLITFNSIYSDPGLEGSIFREQIQGLPTNPTLRQVLEVDAFYEAINQALTGNK